MEELLQYIKTTITIIIHLSVGEDRQMLNSTLAHTVNYRF